MGNFDDLTKRQRLPVLRAVARQVLHDDYGIEPLRLRLVSLTFNTVFRVDRVDGPPLALRVCGRERIHADGVELVEAAWFDRLAADLGWGVPRCVPALDGRVAVEATHHAVPRVVPCSLFTWVRGRPIEEGFDAVGAAATGQLLARLHHHAADLAARGDGPMDRRVMTASIANSIRADRVVTFGDEAAVAAYDGAGASGAVLAEAIDRGRRFLDELWASADAPHLLHGDFGPSNVLRWRRTLTPIDLQDLQLGHAVQDVGLTVADLLDDDVAPEVVASFLTGYHGAGGVAISDDQIEAFRALRALSMVGFCLASPRPGLGPTIDGAVEDVRRWMRRP